MTDKDKLKHDFLNAIVVINSLTKSSSNFVELTSACLLHQANSISAKQIELFQRSMEVIRHETAKMELSLNKMFNKSD
jgi:hypothetical protein